MFDAAAIDAQRRLPQIQGRANTWFCGAWTRYGFHEDGLMSGLAVGRRAARAAAAPAEPRSGRRHDGAAWRRSAPAWCATAGCGRWHNAFDYRTYFLMLPMRRLREQPCAALARNRFGLLAFHDRDHGDGRGDALAWLDELLRAEGIADADGEVWLQTYPRVLGYVFKPVSFWYCERADGSLAAIVVEVNNTFGERHCYLLAGEQLAYGRDLQARKVFHVSPFSHIVGGYRFRFMRSASADGERCVARIDHDDAEGALLQTSLSGRLAPLTPRQRPRRLLRHADDELRRHRPNPLAGAARMGQARALREEAGTARALRHALNPFRAVEP